MVTITVGTWDEEGEADKEEEEGEWDEVGGGNDASGHISIGVETRGGREGAMGANMSGLVLFGIVLFGVVFSKGLPRRVW